MEKQESTKYSIPVSTSIRFCPLYDPNNNLDEARKGFTFETVGDMMSKKVLPKVNYMCLCNMIGVCCSNTYSMLVSQLI